MDKVKYIKLENPDGSYSNSIPLSVDSNYVDVNGTSLTTTLAEKAEKATVNSEISNLSAMINTQKTRIDNLAQLEDGSTTGDAELIDIRTDYKGKSFTNAGAAIRNQVLALKSEIQSANEGLTTFDKTLFLPGHLTMGGEILTNGNNKRRCASNTIFSFPHRITINIAEGFEIAIDIYNNEETSITQALTHLSGTYVIEANTKFKIEVHRAIEDYSEIADVDTFVNAMPFTSNFSSKIDDKINNIAKTTIPELRNGSIGNPGNNKAIATKYVVSTEEAKRIMVKANFSLAEGHYIGWLLSTFSSSGQLSQSTVDKIYDYAEQFTYDNSIIINTEFMAGIAIGMYEYDENNEMVTHRIATDGNLFTINYLKEDEFIYKDIRNGSIPNGGNAYAISFITTDKIPKDYNAVEIWLENPNVTNLKFNISVRTYDLENCGSGAYTTHQVDAFTNYTTNSDNHFTVYFDDFSPAAKSYAVEFWGYNKITGEWEILRTNDISRVRLYYLSLPKSLIEEHVNVAYTRNQDRDVMLAAATRFNKKANNSKDFCILQITDSHSDTVAEKNAVTIANGFQYISAVIHTGDFCADNANNFTEARYNTFINGDKPFYFTCGNHDVGNRKTIASCIDNATFYTRYIAPLVNAGLIEEGEYEEGKGYYYHDFDTYKIRLISVYEYDDPNDIDPNDNTQYIIQRGVSVISQDQAEWFCDTLNSTPSDYSVIVIMHNPFSKKADCVTTAKFNEPDWVNGYGAARFFSTDFWADAVNAYVTRDSAYVCDMVCRGDAEYLNDAQTGKYFSFSYDFSSASGSFLCFLGGHVHRDCVWQHQVYTYQKQITPICANTDNYAQCPTSDIRRTINDSPAKDSLTAIGCDTDNKKLRLVKLGVNVTEDMEYRDFEVIDCNS